MNINGKILKTLFAIVSLLITQGIFAKELFVSTSGNDGLSYDQVSIDNPWRTLNKGLSNLREGDTLYIRAGTYVPSYTTYTKSNATAQEKNNPEPMNSESGTATNPVVIKAYQDEDVLIDMSVAKKLINLDNKSYWVFENLEIINGGSNVIEVGLDQPSENNVFRNLKITLNSGGDNTGTIKLHPRANGTLVENCLLVGPGIGDSIHQNSAALYATKLNQLVVRNSILRNAPIGLYFKHANAPETSDRSDVNILIENNFIYDTSRSSIELNAVGAVVKNNIFGDNNKVIRNAEANGFPGGDYNRFEFNTFFDSSLVLNEQTQSGDANPGSLNNTVYGNLFFKKIAIHKYSSMEHNTTLDYNVYPSGYSHEENNKNYELSNWQSHSSQDLNSVVGTPQFVGSDMSKIESYALAAGSVGKGFIDGDDLGANVALVGPGISVESSGGGAEESAGSGGTEQPSTEIGSEEIAQSGDSECANPRSEWLFCDDFDSTNLNQWEDISKITLNTASSNSYSGSNSAQMNYTAGNSNGGWMWRKNIRPDSSSQGKVYVRWWQKWSSGFEWNSSPGGDQKLINLQALNPRDGWEQSDSQWRVYMHAVGLERSSAGVATNELYVDHYIRTGEGQWDGEWSGYGQDENKHLYRDGVWECTEIEIVESTPGDSNGAMRVWINDELVSQNDNIKIRNDGTSMNAIQVNGWYTDGPSKSQNSWIDNMVVSTSRVGCTNSTASPPLPPLNLGITVGG